MKLPSNYQKRYEDARSLWEHIAFVYERTSQPILAYGPPGTGKSAFPVLYERAKSKETDVLNINKFTSKPDALGHFINTPDGSIFCMNAAARAMVNGRTLVLNEIDHGGPEIMSTLHFICDHQTVAQETLPDGKGTILRAAPGYRVFATMNGDPMLLPEAIRDRFQIKIDIRLPNPAAVDALPDRLKMIAFAEGVTLRNLIAIDDMIKAGIEERRAFQIIFGGKANVLFDAMTIAMAA